MKKQAYTMIALVVLVGSMAVAAQAQNNSRTRMTANIPFEFSAGNKDLPAGQYEISEVNPASQPAALRLRSKDGSVSVLMQMNAVVGRTRESAKLIFRRYGSHYFLAQTWADGESTGLQAPRTRYERAIERELAAIKPSTVTIALGRR
ncbi:MAG TPA: hypothetical protein VJT71_00400 [Pyrinomonadaceae bacterium]|nr:hypothetical protein [Pyrinomonadaceae bacterium]